RLGALPPGHAVDSPEAALDAARAGPLDPENERRARATLAQACTERLAEFATSVPEDQKLLQDSAQPWTLRQMVQARLGEKQLLLHYRKQALRAV
ncbi:MAG: SETD3 family histone-lysine N-methyltransferase, partial [Burkholderiaceae bacterium]